MVEEIEKRLIISSDIAPGAITSSNIASATITGSNIAPGAITSSNIASATIAGSNIAAGTIASSNLAPASTGSLAGTTAGTVTYWQYSLGGIKIFVAYFNGYENDTTTAQTITFPIAYTDGATYISGNSTLPTITVSTTTLTIAAPDTTTLYTGVAVVIGY